MRILIAKIGYDLYFSSSLYLSRYNFSTCVSLHYLNSCVNETQLFNFLNFKLIKKNQLLASKYFLRIFFQFLIVVML